MKLLYYSLTVLIGIIPCLLQSQTQQVYRAYNTQEYMRLIESQDPNYFVNRKLVEAHYHNFKRNPNIEDVKISLIFHVLFNSQNQYIDENTIQAQINILNAQFGQKSYIQGHPSDPRGVFENTLCGDTKITFCLIDEASLEENEENASPINYVETNVNSWDIDNLMKSSVTGGSNPVLPEELINIWICNLNNSNAGFAQLPGGDITTDGIVIDFQYIANHLSTHSEYDRGNTLTHLVANYLNLYDLWWGNCEDDKVSDTPIHNSPNYGCPIYAHSSTCDHTFNMEMTMNYMDNTNDDCQYMFTKDQNVRMHAVLSDEGFRNKLVEFGNCSENNKIANIELEHNEIGAVKIENELIKIYPNPTDGSIHIYTNTDESKLDLSVYDHSGRILISRSIHGQGEINFDLSESITPGIYIIHIKGEVTNYSERIILQH